MQRHPFMLGGATAFVLAFTSATALGQASPAAPPPASAAPAPAPTAAAPEAASAAPAPAAPAAAPAPAPAAAPASAALVASTEPPPSQPLAYPAPAATQNDSAEPASTAHEAPSFIADYDISVPIGGLKDYIGDASFAGVDMVNPWPVWKGLFVGPAGSYHMFDQQQTETYSLDAGAVHGKVYRYAHFVSLAAMVRYVFLKPGTVLRPYIGGRLGAEFVSTTTFVTDLGEANDDVGFMMGGEAGILVRILAQLRFHAGARNVFTTASMDDNDRLSYISFQAGLMLEPDGV